MRGAAHRKSLCHRPAFHLCFGPPDLREPKKVRYCSSKKGGLMKFYTVLTVTVALLAFAGTASAPAQVFAPPSTPVQGMGGTLTSQVQIAERLFTAPVLEPNGSVAVCFATNLDAVVRDLAAQIIDSRGVDVTQTSSCGARLTSGVTCDSTAHFANNSPLRCVVGTSGRATTLRGGMTTSSGLFPFTSPANLTVTAQ